MRAAALIMVLASTAGAEQAMWRDDNGNVALTEDGQFRWDVWQSTGQPNNCYPLTYEGWTEWTDIAGSGTERLTWEEQGSVGPRSIDNAGEYLWRSIRDQDGSYMRTDLEWLPDGTLQARPELLPDTRRHRNHKIAESAVLPAIRSRSSG
jgi:hypothetical protein